MLKYGMNMKPTACPGDVYFFQRLPQRCSGGIQVQNL
jgi:hypothetical protein